MHLSFNGYLLVFFIGYSANIGSNYGSCSVCEREYLGFTYYYCDYYSHRGLGYYRDQYNTPIDEIGML